jgi:hypothetical protein
MKRKITISLILFCACINQVFAQGTLSGTAFLKTLPGARAQSMGGAYSAIVDDPNSVFANPGAAGFLREWQWSASYTKWFADVSNASAFFGGRVRMPWSRQTRFAVGLLYQGVPEFDSSNGAMPVVSSSDAIASFSIGQPISFISNNLSLGANVKYLDSKLADYSANALIIDAGLLGRTNTFHIFNKEAALSFGIAQNQFGKELVFEQYQTPLPLTRRAGLGLYFGSHFGNQFLITADYVQIKDKSDYMTIGAEAVIKRKFALNFGWDFGIDLMQRFTAGASIRLDDSGYLFSKKARNQALRLDFASLNDSRFVGRTYRGTITHTHNHPEGYRFLNWAKGDSLFDDDVTLKWESTLDRDVFDAVRYRIVASQDRAQMADIVEALSNNDREFESIFQDSLFNYASSTTRSSLNLDDVAGGHWYWVVAAIDRDEHVRLANIAWSRNKIAHFIKPMPDICVQNFKYDYYRTIDQTDYHGKISFDVANIGAAAAFDVDVKLADLAAKIKHVLSAGTKTDSLSWSIDVLKASETRTIRLDWRTSVLGAHQFVIDAEIREPVKEIDAANNHFEQLCFTVPKGYVASPDTNVFELVSEVSINMPLITVVDFAAFSTEVPRIYLHKSIIDPHLGVLAERLKANPWMKVGLSGTINNNLDEFDTGLADARAEAVRDTLIKIGVKENQIQVLAPQVNEIDQLDIPATMLRWINEEKSSVIITADNEAQKILFASIKHRDVETFLNGAAFDVNIRYALQADAISIPLRNGELEKKFRLVGAPFDIIQQTNWRPEDIKADDWLNGETAYSAVVMDSLGRVFKTPLDSTQFINKFIAREMRKVIPNQFEKTERTYNVFWEQLYNQAKELFATPGVRLKIEGHACRIDPYGVNEKLADDRASTFHNDFLEFVQLYHSGDYSMMKQRMDAPVGYSDRIPLGIKHLDGTFVEFGNNNLPIGRKMNRRIEINFYMAEY